MKEYKVVMLNSGVTWSRKKDVEKTEQTLNEIATEGWELVHVMSPNDIGGAIIGFFGRDKQ